MIPPRLTDVKPDLPRLVAAAQQGAPDLGARLLERCLEAAAVRGFRTCYLETLDSMGRARKLYEAFGFRRLCGPEGSTGHFACDAYYALDLKARGRRSAS